MVLFEGKQIARVDGKRISVNYLEGDFGRDCFEEYQRLVAAEYDSNEVLRVAFRFDETPSDHDMPLVKGSNPRINILMNKILSEKGVRVATPADAEAVINSGVLDLREKYVYTALAIRNDEEDPNNYDSLIFLMNNLKERNISYKFPFIIPLSDLELIARENSKDGVVSRLKESSEVIYSPQISDEYDGDTFTKTDNYGLPIFDENGSRTIYPLEDHYGLSALGIDKELDLVFDGGSLTGAGDAGSIIVVKEEN